MENIVKLEPGKFYHIFNRGNNNGTIFFEEQNYTYFLDCYRKSIVGIVGTFADCLSSAPAAGATRTESALTPLQHDRSRTKYT